MQGCCHGAPAPARVGIRYLHPRSRVTRLTALAGVSVHPTQLYAILGNAATALVVARLWFLHLSVAFVCGAYLILTGLGRFVEESRRGEPQTPAAALLPASALGGPPAFGLVTWMALGVDLPDSRLPLSRLAQCTPPELA